MTKWIFHTYDQTGKSIRITVHATSRECAMTEFKFLYGPFAAIDMITEEVDKPVEGSYYTVSD